MAGILDRLPTWLRPGKPLAQEPIPATATVSMDPGDAGSSGPTSGLASPAGPRRGNPPPEGLTVISSTSWTPLVNHPIWSAVQHEVAYDKAGGFRSRVAARDARGVVETSGWSKAFEHHADANQAALDSRAKLPADHSLPLLRPAASPTTALADIPTLSEREAATRDGPNTTTPTIDAIVRNGMDKIVAGVPPLPMRSLLGEAAKAESEAALEASWSNEGMAASHRSKARAIRLALAVRHGQDGEGAQSIVAETKAQLLNALQDRVAMVKLDPLAGEETRMRRQDADKAIGAVSMEKAMTVIGELEKTNRLNTSQAQQLRSAFEVTAPAPGPAERPKSLWPATAELGRSHQRMADIRSVERRPLPERATRDLGR